MKLNVDFVSQQQEPGERPILNDCGPACLSALTGLPLEKIYQVAKLKPGDMMHMTQILDALTALRVPREHVRPLHLPDARRWLANGNPIVALINYGRLPRELRATEYTGNHFVLIVGYTADGSFFVHDPLWPGEAGAYRRWSDVQLGEAWANPIKAMPLQGIVVQRPFPVTEPEMAELGLAVNAALSSTVATNYLEQLLNAMAIAPGPLAQRVDRALARVAVWRAGEPQ